ncbi:MAG TPA: hypothetical protein VKA27_10975 [Sunxiuqinia sp.]|nr:hypothetical protein [Sunxiuqinia sp.]
MKTHLLILVLAISLLGLFSCNNDFLNQNSPALYTLDTPLEISSQYPTNSITLHIPNADNENYYIRTQPKWLDLSPLQGTFKDGKISLLYTFQDPGFQMGQGYYSANLTVVVEHVGYFQLEVRYGDFGDPTNPTDTTGTTPGGNEPNVDEGTYLDLQGTVIDAAYDKSSDQLVIATESPNQLVLVNTSAWTKSSIPLDYTPKCIDLSNDGKIYVGYTIARLSEFDLATQTSLQEFDLDFVPFDVAAGNNGWLYLAPGGQNHQSLHCLNLSTGEMFIHNDDAQYEFYANTIIKKLKGKPVLAATRTELSPNGLLLFDISKGMPNDTIDYWHASFEHLWPFSGGKLFLGGFNGEVYFMPDYEASTEIKLQLNTYGQLSYVRPYPIDMDDCDTIHSLFVAEGNSYFDDTYQQKAGYIEQFDATSLALQHTYRPSPRVIDQNGTSVEAYQQVRFVFTNNAGTKLYAVRRIAPDFNINQWSVEQIDIQ